MCFLLDVVQGKKHKSFNLYSDTSLNQHGKNLSSGLTTLNSDTSNLKTLVAHCLKSSFFVQKFNFDFPRKIVEFVLVRTRENAAVLDFLGVDNFDFARKFVQISLGENS